MHFTNLQNEIMMNVTFNRPIRPASVTGENLFSSLQGRIAMHHVPATHYNYKFHRTLQRSSVFEQPAYLRLDKVR